MRAASAADSCPPAPSPGLLKPQLRPLLGQWAAGVAGSMSGSRHPVPQHCPGACQSHCSPPARTAGPRGKVGCSTPCAVTWGGTAPSTGTWQDSPPSPAQACLRDWEEGTHHHTSPRRRRRGRRKRREGGMRDGGIPDKAEQEQKWETRGRRRFNLFFHDLSEHLNLCVHKGTERANKGGDEEERERERGVSNSPLRKMSRLSLFKCFIHPTVGVSEQWSHLPFNSLSSHLFQPSSFFHCIPARRTFGLMFWLKHFAWKMILERGLILNPPKTSIQEWEEFFFKKGAGAWSKPRGMRVTSTDLHQCPDNPRKSLSTREYYTFKQKAIIQG